jgi:hypothetical protein
MLWMLVRLECICVVNADIFVIVFIPIPFGLLSIACRSERSLGAFGWRHRPRLGLLIEVALGFF